MPPSRRADPSDPFSPPCEPTLPVARSCRAIVSARAPQRSGRHLGQVPQLLVVAGHTSWAGVSCRPPTSSGHRAAQLDGSRPDEIDTTLTKIVELLRGDLTATVLNCSIL